MWKYLNELEQLIEQISIIICGFGDDSIKIKKIQKLLSTRQKVESNLERKNE